MLTGFDHMPDIKHVPARDHNIPEWDKFYTEEEFIPY